MTTQLVGPEVPTFEGDLEQPDASSVFLLARVVGQSRTGLALGVQRADAERVDRLAALEDLKAAASAAQALLAAELDTSRRMAEAARGVPAGEQGRGVAHEVALARHESPHAGGRLLGLGKALVREMPHTLDALSSGTISEWRATLLVRETACLTREDRATVDQELAGTPEAAVELGRMGTRAIVAAAQRIAYRLDPHAVVDRSSRAVGDRYASLRPAPDCMARISALVPVAQGVATYAALKAEADAARAAGDSRTRGQVMADTLVARVTGQESAEAAPVCVNLTMDADALRIGRRRRRAVRARSRLHGAGARRDRGPHPRRRSGGRSLGAAPVHPPDLRPARLGGVPPALLPRRHRAAGRPGPRPTCHTPWCDAPAVHTDHVLDHAKGGRTALPNAQGLCEACSYAKSLPGWRALPVGEGTGPPIAVITTTPTEHVYESGRGP